MMRKTSTSPGSGLVVTNEPNRMNRRRQPVCATSLKMRSKRRLRGDWQQVYQHDLALAETFIEQDRFGGRSYAAANWICVGQTQGRGRNDRLFQGGLPIKTIWLYPLRRDFRQVLCAPEP